MPIPDLDKTLDKYLVALEPTVTAAQFAEAEAAVEKFRTGEGPELHQALVAKDQANLHTSYINAWWFDMYVSDRRPLPINYNPTLTFAQDPRVEEDPRHAEPTRRAADMLVSSVRFMKTYNAGVLKPDVFTLGNHKDTALYNTLMRLIPPGLCLPSFAGGHSLHSVVGSLNGAYPLDMSQLHNLFCSTRIPGKLVDTIVKAEGAGADSPPYHVVVQRRTRFYKLQVTTNDGSEIPAVQLRAALDSMIADDANHDDATSVPLGILTAMKRDEWASVRGDMEKSPVNAAALAEIDRAMLLVVLDEASPETEEELFKTMLTGDGRNRWFDKSISLVFCANGRHSLNFEHSWGDGVAVLRYCNEVFEDANNAPLVEEQADGTDLVECLKWDVPAGGEVATAATNAGREFDEWLGRMNLTIRRSDDVTTGTALRCCAAVFDRSRIDSHLSPPSSHTSPLIPPPLALTPPPMLTCPSSCSCGQETQDWRGWIDADGHAAGTPQAAQRNDCVDVRVC
jgi:carnitine O-palmitoyltransferase 2